MSVDPAAQDLATPKRGDLRESLARVVDAERVASAGQADAVDGLQPKLVVEPASVAEAAGVLAWANDRGLRVCPRGGGSKLGWGNAPSRLDLVLSTRRLNGLVEHVAGDMTATVECGQTLQAFQDALGRAGQMLALDAPFSERATIGGVIATNDSGPLRLRYGGVRDLLIGVTFLRADGGIVKGGGKVVKNVAGYDLPKLMTGALGTLGLLVQATFRLHPKPASSRTLVTTGVRIEQAQVILLKTLDSNLTPTGLSLRWAGEAAAELFLRFGGLPLAVEAQVEGARELAAGSGVATRLLETAEADAAWRELGDRRWSGGENGLVFKCSILPSDIGALVERLDSAFRRLGLNCRAVIHGHGLGLVTVGLERPQPADSQALVSAVAELRSEIAKRHGTLVVLAAPAEVKRRLDVWGPAPDALAVMRRIKTQFDPNGILNPGRYAGGI